MQQWKRETNDGASEGTDAESSSTEAEDDSRENVDEGSRDIFDHGTQNSPPANIWSDSSTGMPTLTGSGQVVFESRSCQEAFSVKDSDLVPDAVN